MVRKTMPSALMFQVRGIPQTLIIDRDGIIGDVFYGPVTLSRLEQSLAKIE